jgi:hypothetical protein
VEECGAVVGADFAVLLEFDNVVPDLPVGFEELGIYGLERTATTGGVGLGNPIDQILVVGDGLDFRRHGGESEKYEGGSMKEESASGALAIRE